MQFDDSSSAVHHHIVVHNALAFMLSILIDQVCFACTNVLRKLHLVSTNDPHCNICYSCKSAVMKFCESSWYRCLLIACLTSP